MEETSGQQILPVSGFSVLSGETLSHSHFATSFLCCLLCPLALGATSVGEVQCTCLQVFFTTKPGTKNQPVSCWFLTVCWKSDHSSSKVMAGGAVVEIKVGHHSFLLSQDQRTATTRNEVSLQVCR